MANEQKKYLLQAETSKLEYISEETPYGVFTEWKNIGIFLTKEEAEKVLKEECFPCEKFRIVEY